MGREQFYVEAEGINEREAYRNACDEARAEYGHQDGYSGQIHDATDYTTKCLRKPKPSSKCSVTHANVGVTKKWVTTFEVKPFWSSDNGRSTSARTKGDAIKLAKEYALKYNIEYAINVSKQLSNSGSDVARVTPKKSITGIYAFKGEARC